MSDRLDAVLAAIQSNAETSARLLAAAEALKAAQGHASQGGGKAEIHFNGNGIAVWISSFCCAAMFVAGFFISLAVYWIGMNTRDQGHQMNALYQSVPGLRELVDRQMKLNEQTKKAQPREEKR